MPELQMNAHSVWRIAGWGKCISSTQPMLPMDRDGRTERGNANSKRPDFRRFFSAFFDCNFFVQR
jgi:hypothetical protein